MLGPGALSVDVRVLRDVYDPGCDAVLSLGRPVDPRRAPGATQPVLDAVRGLGVEPCWYDGGAATLSFADPSNPARLIGRAASGAERHVTLFARGARPVVP